MTSPSSPRFRPQRPGLAALLVVSGALALVYEVLWQRQFALLFGSAAPATAAVLAAYFAGLGAGSLWAARRQSRAWHPLRTYAWLELVVAGGALLVPLWLRAFESVYPMMVTHAGTGGGLLLLARTALVFVAIALPTAAMGATLPFIGAMADAGQRQLGRTAGWFYVANTAGAAAGALAVPFVFLRFFGLSATAWIAAGGNLALAVVAACLARSTPAAPVGGNADAIARPGADDAGRLPVLLLGASGLSGAVTFALQIWWNRAFAQVHDNSIYSFALLVAVVVLALAIGGQLARTCLARQVPPLRVLSMSWLTGGTAVMAGPFIFLQLSDQLAYLPNAEGGFAGSARGLSLLLACVGLPLMLLGLALPALMEAAGRRCTAGAHALIGKLLAANIGGAVAGSLAAGFWLPAVSPLWGNLFVTGGLLVAAGAALHARRSVHRWMLGVTALACAIALAQLPLPRVHRADPAADYVLSLREGTHGITAVVDGASGRRLKLNNHYALGGTASQGDERMQAHLPLLLHPDPREVAFLGLGTGITAGAALLHPDVRLTAIELVPEVITAAREHFTAANLDVTRAARAEVQLDDARHFLRATSRRFDVIIGDLVVPWRQGEAALYTREQFSAARRALHPHGLYCQWIPLFQLTDEDFSVLAHTFLDVFPHTWIWRGDFSSGEPALALVGLNHGTIDFPATVAQRLPLMHRDASNPHLLAPALWMYAVGPLQRGDLPAETRRNTEDRPWIELLGPLRHGGATTSTRWMTGITLERWLEHVSAAAPRRAPELTPSEQAAMAAGRAFATFLRAAEAGDRAAAFTAHQHLQELLPPEVLRAFFP